MCKSAGILRGLEKGFVLRWVQLALDAGGAERKEVARLQPQRACMRAALNPRRALLAHQCSGLVLGSTMCFTSPSMLHSRLSISSVGAMGPTSCGRAHTCLSS